MHGRDVGLGRLDLGEDPLGVGDQRGPGRGRPDAAAVADDERRPGLGLEPGDRLRDRRLGVGQRLRRRGERAPLDDLAEHLQPAQVQH